MIANSFYYNLDRMEELSLLLFILYGICRVKLKNRLSRHVSPQFMLSGAKKIGHSTHFAFFMSTESKIIVHSTV